MAGKSPHAINGTWDNGSPRARKNSEIETRTRERLKRCNTNSPFVIDPIELEVLMNTIARLRAALTKSVELQSHYARLLNEHDGGERITFRTADEWLDRLAILASHKEKTDG